MFKEHEVFIPPKNKLQKIWRYMDFTKFISLLEKKTLFFTRADKFKDPFEGKFSKANLKKLNKLNDSISKKDLQNIMNPDGKVIKQLRQTTNINCWHMSERESDAMWKLYLKSDEGVAIQSNYKNLRDCFMNCRENIHIGKVKYIDYDKQNIPFDSMYRPFLYKRKCFEHETELRAIYSLTNDKKIPDIGKHICVNINMLIKKVYVSPLAENWFTNLVQSVVTRYNLDTPIIHSKLYEY